jgi:environmental stress-induced protein Ves
MRIIRVDDQPEVPWKNGGGVTREMLSSASGPNGFDWRISVATIAKDGPFSEFPGVDRILIGLVGEGRLRVSGRIDNVAPGSVSRFAGDEPVMATIGQSPILVLNIMTAKGWRQDVSIPRCGGSINRRLDGTRIFAVLGSSGDSGLRSGDLILDIDDANALSDISLIGIDLIEPRQPLIPS